MANNDVNDKTAISHIPVSEANDDWLRARRLLEEGKHEEYDKLDSSIMIEGEI